MHYLQAISTPLTTSAASAPDVTGAASVVAPGALDVVSIDPDQFAFLGIAAVIIVFLLAAVLAAQLRRP